MDLILTRLNAHFHFIYPRIYSEKKRKEFAEAISALNNGQPLAENKHGGVKMAIDIYNEIVQIHKDRFENSRNGDCYLEKL
jgi:hypothetical protein